jgi:formate dehydrogenase subunit gamma
MNGKVGATMMKSHEVQLPNFLLDDSASDRLDDRVHRFTLTERLLHWWVVATFSAALLTGLAMGDEAESGPLLRTHIIAVALIGVGVIVALIFGNTMAVLISVRDLFIFNRTDVTCLKMTLAPVGRKNSRVPWGKFNVGQKLLAWALLVALSALIVTGVNSWNSGGDAAGPHSAAVIACLVLLGSHVFMALVNPSTRPAFPGMVVGHVRRSWAEHHHSGWLEKQDARRR